MLSSYQGLDLISHLKLQGGEQNDIIVWLLQMVSGI